jgi:L-alanine-DL-glutamate epimerase-like enolase superfamily enzyme
MRIVEIREAAAPVGSAIRNAFLDFSRMTTSVVCVVSDVVRDGRPLVGYGYSAPGRYAQGEILRDRLIPRVLAAAPDGLLDQSGPNFDPARILACAMRDEKPGGHGERAVAMAALDTAVWDLVAKVADVPLWQLIATRYNDGAADASVGVYPGGGYYAPDKGLDELKAEIRGYLDLGYRSVKIKIGGADLGEDLSRIEAVLEVVGSGDHLAVDANGRFDAETALRYGAAMAPYELKWYEEPGDPLDYALNAEVARNYDGALATGECLMSLPDARNLARYGGLRADRDWLQFDPALCYGPTTFLDIVALFAEHGFSRRRHLPHGGHQLGLNLAAGLQLGGAECYPNVFQPLGGYADDIPIEDGQTTLPDAPGLGVECKAALYAMLQKRLEI